MQKARRHHSRGSDRLQAHGFRVSFTPLSGVLFTFPSRYSSTIGLPGVLSLGGWCRRIRTGLLRPRPTQGTARARERCAYGAVTLCGAPFQAASATPASSQNGSPTTPRAPRRTRFGLAPFRSPLLGGSLLFSSPPATWMFRFAGFAPAQRRVPRLQRGGLPHSDTRGSTAARASPRTIAACRVLHRLREPKASPVRPLSLVAIATGIARQKDETCPLSTGDANPTPPPLRAINGAKALFSYSFPPILSKNRGGASPPHARDRGIEPLPKPARRTPDAGRAQHAQHRTASNRRHTRTAWRHNRPSHGTPAHPTGRSPLKLVAASTGTRETGPPERRCSSRTFRYGYLVTT